MTELVSFKKLLTAILISCSLALLTSCGGGSDDEDEEDTSNAYVNTPAWPVIEEEQNLALFFLSTFDYDPDRDHDPADDNFVAFFWNFSPQSNIEPDEDDIDQTTNDLLFEETAWEDSELQWVTNEKILSSPQSVFQKSRSYRLLTDSDVGDEQVGKNRPIFEAIEEDVFTKHLGTTYIWDFGDFDDAEDENLEGEKLEDYEFSEGGYSLLPNVEIWSDIDNTDETFSSNAMLYTASFSVNEDNFVIEAVDDDNGNYSLAAANFDNSSTSLVDAIALFQEPTRLPFKFTTNFIENKTVHMGFDSATQRVVLATTSSAGSEVVTVDYRVNAAELYAEIDIQDLSRADLETLGLETTFNPIIIGPVPTEGFFIAKHYIKTTKETRENLPPVFLFNTEAQNDIQATFKAFRDAKYEEFYD
jgi:hypothetical protein